MKTTLLLLAMAAALGAQQTRREIVNAAPTPAQDDAAPMENLKVRGSGFCAINSSRSASPAGFMVLALAGLALLRRRRR